MQRTEFRFFHRLRVRWAEVDMQKIVFNAHYLMFFDTAMTDYWRALALPYEEAMRQLGGELYVKKATLEFHASARMDDRLDVALKCERIGNSSMTFAGAVFRGEELLITCELVYVFADPTSQTSTSLPHVLRQALADYEAGQPMVKVETGRWTELGDAAKVVRNEVFVKEQKIPLDLEWDAQDAAAVHAVVWNQLGRPVATGRLLQPQQGVAQIGRMAVHRLLRDSGIGKQVLLALAAAACARGDREAMLHAQRSAETFYSKLGFRPRGEPFSEAGIAHIEMFAQLPLRQS
jgi:YbgC/YbaW family acyl-CoA thioester hydrolase